MLQALPAIIGAGTAVAGILGSKKKNKKPNPLDAILAELQGVQSPTAEQAQWTPATYGYEGTYSPEAESVQELGPSGFANLQYDPTGRSAQIDALSQLRNIASSGGLTAADKARLAEASTTLGTTMRGAREALMQRAAASGRLGSGMELAQQLSAGQEGATAAAQMASDAARSAEMRNLEAIRSMGSLGGTISEQDYGRAAQKAKAADEIARFNVANRQNVFQRNIEAANQARLREGDIRQKLGETNVTQENLRRQGVADSVQKAFENKIRLAQAKAGVAAPIAQSDQAEADRRQQFYSGLIGLGGNLMSMYSPSSKKKTPTQEV